MARTDPITALILKRVAAEEHREREAIDRRVDAQIAAGPPAHSGVTPAAWAKWWRSGWCICPAEKRELTCRRPECMAGALCRDMKAKGLYGNGVAMPRQERPLCGAKTRAGGSCIMRVEPGRKRCRLHGGFSTGPRTPQGKERIRQGQLHRWTSKVDRK